jgi:2-polyprenyl-3-methyl-5-hydroxy-6-metoxy-1,4-benzoquinol methylase
MHTSPQLSNEALAKLYDGVYAYSAHDLVRKEKQKRAQGLIALAGRSFTERTEVLEIGCGSGVLLLELQKLGMRVRGCELSDQAATLANHALGMEKGGVFSGGFTDYLESNGSVPDLVIMSHVLEHFTNPKEVLTILRTKLDGNGLLLIVVPNAGKSPRGWLKKFWGYWQVPVHTVHFELESLTNMLEKSGFEVAFKATRNADFLSIVLFFLNVFKVESENANPSIFQAWVIRRLSYLWSFAYRIGNSDLIVGAKTR